MDLADKVAEWFLQADYDLGTARYMLDGGRRFYAVFMAHLAVEKALKGVYQHRLKKMAPKTHDLILLCESCGIELEANRRKFLTLLTQAQVASRYPDCLEDAQRKFSRNARHTNIP